MAPRFPVDADSITSACFCRQAGSQRSEICGVRSATTSLEPTKVHPGWDTRLRGAGAASVLQTVSRMDSTPDLCVKQMHSWNWNIGLAVPGRVGREVHKSFFPHRRIQVIEFSYQKKKKKNHTIWPVMWFEAGPSSHVTFKGHICKSNQCFSSLSGDFHELRKANPGLLSLLYFLEKGHLVYVSCWTHGSKHRF